MSGGDQMAKRYYWLKLHEDFFRQKDIKKLRQIAGGDTYTIIYLKMLLHSLSTGGKLYYDGVEENFPNELALDIDENAENVAVTVQFLTSRGILLRNTEEEYELLTTAEMTGSESSSASRVRRYRDRRALQCDVEALQCNKNVTTEKEIEKRARKKRKSLEMADKPPRASRFTPPTVDEVAAYCTERGNCIDGERFVDYYAQQGWKLSNGNAMKDWRAAVRTWEKREQHGNATDKPYEYDPGDLTGDLSTML